jgi:hypothetical protein
MNNNDSASNNSIQTKKFNVNYQIVFENYSNAIKYYIKNRQLIDELEKIILGYKDIIKDFQKKIMQLNLNLTKLCTINDKSEKFFYKNDTSIYPLIKKYIKFIKNILTYQIDSFTEQINDFENQNIFKFSNKKDDNYMNVLQKNKNNLQNEEKRMEKLIIDYDNEYDNLIDTFSNSEDKIKQFFVNKRKSSTESKKQKKNTIFEQTISKTLESEEHFNAIFLNFKKYNNNYFDIYEKYIKELEKEINNNFIYLDKIVNEFISILFYNYNNINKKLIQLNKNLIKKKEEQSTLNDKIDDNQNLKNKEEEKGDINSDFSLFKNKYLNKFEIKYAKEKYKVKSIHETINKDGITKETKNIMNILSDEFGMDDLFQENPIIITEEDIYDITKTFYGAFQFVDKTEYDLMTEKKKLEIRQLTNKLLYFGLKKRNNKEFKELKEINEKEVDSLEKYFNKKEYRIIFLKRLNNYRAIGIFDIPKREFEIICRFFKIIADKIYEEKDNDSMKYMLILSQTFYMDKDGQKYYIQKELKGNKLFNEKECMEKYIRFCINEEIEKVKENIKKNNLNENNYSFSTIAFSHLLPFCNNMIDFGMKKELLMELIEPIFEEYKVTEEMKQNIQEIIKSKSVDA